MQFLSPGESYHLKSVCLFSVFSVFTIASNSDYIRQQNCLSVISFSPSYPLHERGLEWVGEGLCVLPTVDWDGERNENAY